MTACPSEYMPEQLMVLRQVLPSFIGLVQSHHLLHHGLAPDPFGQAFNRIAVDPALIHGHIEQAREIPKACLGGAGCCGR
mmetsp:Transcript_30327/g.71274  ORF Transcript_30327/g.71274 Transcript_30327/m.71274 type:complete len:80 (-) Transcript_30327:936-1175(-)